MDESDKNSTKKKLLFVVIMALIVIGIVVALVLRKHSSSSGGGGGGGNGGGGNTTCSDLFHSCANNSCCAGIPCKDGICLYQTTAPTMYAFQLRYKKKCLTLDPTSHMIALQDNCNWEQNWWSWDQKNLRFNTMINNQPVSTCVGGPIAAGQALQMVNKGDCHKQQKIRLMAKDNIAYIQDVTTRYSAVLTPIKENKNAYQLLWVKTIDSVGTGNTGTIFEVVSKEPGADCLSVGDSCTGTGDHGNCCAPFKNCQSGLCRSCVGPIPTCHDNSEFAKCQPDSTWKCVSKCNVDDKPKSCSDGLAPICLDSGKWECVSKCQGQSVPDCPNYTCEKGSDGQYSYRCSEVCGGDHTHVPPPPQDLVDELKSCTEEDDPSKCSGTQTAKRCFKCDDGYKILYWNCDNNQWEIDYGCGPDKPDCNATCTALNPDFCTEKGHQWVCDQPKNWCHAGSAEKLKQHNACLPGDNSCDTPIWFMDGTPIWPTISYNNCSSMGGDTEWAGQDMGPLNVNKPGYLEVTGPINDRAYNLYPSDKSFTYNGVETHYSNDYSYYKPENRTKTANPQFCMMKNPCNDGSFVMKDEYALKDHANFTETDPRKFCDTDSGKCNTNNPPTPEAMRNVGSCECGSKAGYFCSIPDGTKYCNGGVAVTDATGKAPSPGVVCKCPWDQKGDRCEKSAWEDSEHDTRYCDLFLHNNDTTSGGICQNTMYGCKGCMFSGGKNLEGSRVRFGKGSISCESCKDRPSKGDSKITMLTIPGYPNAIGSQFTSTMPGQSPAEGRLYWNDGVMRFNQSAYNSMMKDGKFMDGTFQDSDTYLDNNQIVSGIIPVCDVDDDCYAWRDLGYQGADIPKCIPNDKAGQFNGFCDYKTDSPTCKKDSDCVSHYPDGFWAAGKCDPDTKHCVPTGQTVKNCPDGDVGVCIDYLIDDQQWYKDDGAYQNAYKYSQCKDKKCYLNLPND